MNICKTLLLSTAVFSSNVGVEMKYLIMLSQWSEARISFDKVELLK